MPFLVTITPTLKNKLVPTQNAPPYRNMKLSKQFPALELVYETCQTLLIWHTCRTFEVFRSQRALLCHIKRLECL